MKNMTLAERTILKDQADRKEVFGPFNVPSYLGGTKGEAVQAAIKRSKGQGKGAGVPTQYGAPLREESASDEQPESAGFAVTCSKCGASIPAEDSIGDEGKDYCIACAGSEWPKSYFRK